MPFDGIFLSAVCQSLAPAIGAKVDKVYQPTHHELVLVLRGPSFTGRLLLCADPSAPRIHLTDTRPDNPPQAPAFCMLLRKALAGARLREVRQMGLDRLVTLAFDTANEMGDAVTRSLICELMGRCANVILTENGRILDALRRVDFSMSADRPILPGGHYEFPAPQDKRPLAKLTVDELRDALASGGAAKNTLLSLISGLSPLLAREILVRAGYSSDLRAEQADVDRLWQGIQWLSNEIDNNSCFTVLQEESKGNFEFSLVDIAQYGEYVKKTVYPSSGALLDEYYAARARESVVQARGADLKKTVQTQMSRLSRKLTVLQADREDNQKKEKYRSYGDLITANIYRIREGDEAVTAMDYTDPACPEITIELDKDLSPSTNAQRYYKIYRKAKTAIEHLIVEQEKAAKELQYLESVLDALSRAETGAEVSEIREELIRGGYLRAQGKKAKPQKALPHKFIFGGVEILAGKNNLQNEQLTHHVAQKNEWWLHRLDAPGSHVIVRDAEADESTLTFAAQVAALYSAGDQAGKTAVDLTRARYVKKIPGAGPGMVTYTNQTTLYVTPDRETVEKYREK